MRIAPTSTVVYAPRLRVNHSHSLSRDRAASACLGEPCRRGGSPRALACVAICQTIWGDAWHGALTYGMETSLRTAARSACSRALHCTSARSVQQWASTAAPGLTRLHRGNRLLLEDQKRESMSRAGKTSERHSEGEHWVLRTTRCKNAGGAISIDRVVIQGTAGRKSALIEKFLEAYSVN